MKRMMALLAAILLILLFAQIQTVFAFTSSIQVQDIGEVDQNGTYTVSYSLIGDENMTFNGTVSVEGGDLISVTLEGGQTNVNRIVYNSGMSSSANGTVQFKVTHPAQIKITISGDMSSVTSLVKNDVSGSRTLPVRSEERKAYEESVATSIAESIAQSNAAREAEERRIREEQERIAREEAERQARINASIAESIRVEQSIKESIYNQSMSSYWAQSAIEKSLSIEASLADLTRAYEIDGTYFVPYTIESAAALPGNFLFAVEDTDLYTPEEYVQKELVINTQNVLAYQTPSMASNIYLVFGRFSEEEEPAFYFYNTKTGYFFPYDLLYGEVTEPESESETESSTEEETTESPTEETTVETAAESEEFSTAEEDEFRAYVSGWDLLTLGGLGILAGACVTGLIAVIARRKRENQAERLAEESADSTVRNNTEEKDAGIVSGTEEKTEGVRDTASETGGDQQDTFSEELDDSIFDKEIDELL